MPAIWPRSPLERYNPVESRFIIRAAPHQGGISNPFEFSGFCLQYRLDVFSKFETLVV